MIKVGLVTMDSECFELEKNVKKIIDFIKESKELGIQIVCFPELSLTGYVINIRQRLKRLEDFKKDLLKYEKKIEEASLLYEITVLVGTVEIEGNKIFISQKVYSKKGYQGSYRKMYLGEKEKNNFTEGKEVKVFEVNADGYEIKFGIGICYDMHFPEIAMECSLQGSQMFFAPHALSAMSTSRRLDVWNKYMCARAYDNRMYVMALNSVYLEQRSGGGVACWDCNGTLVSKYLESKEKLYKINIDINEIEKYRNVNNKTMKNRFFLKDRIKLPNV
ncbi:nitrilase family protein [Clostridium sediminicola]|uniref:nitrilase-related carbon-nitrogen hydrolase n=1 Tax=Clostridium sediminicola TaxID=3114879 RepID=UPI0031F241F9